MKNTANELTTVTAREGKTLAIAGGNYRIVITGAQTGGAYAVIEMLVPPGGGPGPHAHAGFRESFYVLEGEVEFKSQEGSFVAQKGSFINIPLGGMVHCFKNKTGAVAKLLCTVVPAGLEDFFAALGQPAALGEFLAPPLLNEAARKHIAEVAEQYGQHFYPPDFFE